VRLPLLVSVPHAGTRVPEEVAPWLALSSAEVARDGDEQAADIYGPLRDRVTAFVSADVARAFVDVNRAEYDRGKDGVVKTHTCWDVPVYQGSLPEEIVERLLERYYRPYHARLSDLSRSVVAGLDCHTMAAVGPPVGPDPGRERPRACVSNADGTCPPAWLQALTRCLETKLGPEVRMNDPFKGGFITRAHASEIPWVQLELSRAPFATVRRKRDAVARALEAWAQVITKS